MKDTGISRQVMNVFRPRSLVEAEYSISKTQNDLMDYVMGLVAAEPEEYRDNLVYEIKIKDLIPFYDIDNEKNIYTIFRNMVSMSIKDTFMIKGPDGEDVECFWVQTAYYDNKTCRIKVKLGEDFKAILNAIKMEKGPGAYYCLSTTFPLSSQYSKRIYYMCKEWAGKGSSNIRYDTVSGLRAKLCVPESYRYGIFKIRVLEKAVEEINEKTDINVSFEERYENVPGGKKVVGITWHIQKKNQTIIGPEDL